MLFDTAPGRRAAVRGFLAAIGAAALVVLLFATGATSDQRASYDRFFLYLPTSVVMLAAVLVLTDLGVGAVERHSSTEARSTRTIMVLVAGLTLAGAILATVLLTWFR